MNSPSLPAWTCHRPEAQFGPSTVVSFSRSSGRRDPTSGGGTLFRGMVATRPGGEPRLEEGAGARRSRAPADVLPPRAPYGVGSGKVPP
jgi:hypothetical protein